MLTARQALKHCASTWGWEQSTGGGLHHCGPRSVSGEAKLLCVADASLSWALRMEATLSLTPASLGSPLSAELPGPCSLLALPEGTRGSPHDKESAQARLSQVLWGQKGVPRGLGECGSSPCDLEQVLSSLSLCLPVCKPGGLGRNSGTPGAGHAGPREECLVDSRLHGRVVLALVPFLSRLPSALTLVRSRVNPVQNWPRAEPQADRGRSLDLIRSFS